MSMDEQAAQVNLILSVMVLPLFGCLYLRVLATPFYTQ